MEHFARVAGFGWVAQEHDERVGGGVHDGHEVVERFDGEDLRFVEHFNVSGVQASSKPMFAGAERNKRPILEADLLLPVGAADAVHVWFEHAAARVHEVGEVVERLV